MGTPEQPQKPPEPPALDISGGLTILDIFGSAEKVELKRWSGDTREWKYVRRLSRDEFETDPDFIGRTWGGGWYDVREVIGKDYGKRQLRIWYDEAEWGPARGSHPTAPAELATPQPEQLSATASTIMAAVAAATPLLRELVSAVKGQPLAATSPLATLKEMCDVMKGLMPPAQALDADATVKRAVEMLQLGMSFGAKMSGGTDWASIIDKGGSTVERVVTAAVQAAGAVKRLPAPSGGDGNGHVEPGGSKPAPELGPLFTMACAQIAAMAEKSMLPERAAQEILGFVPAAFFDEFAERLRDQDMVRLITTAHQGLSAHQEWLTRVIAALKPMVEEVERQRSAAPAS